MQCRTRTETKSSSLTRLSLSPHPFYRVGIPLKRCPMMFAPAPNPSVQSMPQALLTLLWMTCLCLMQTVQMWGCPPLEGVSQIWQTHSWWTNLTTRELSTLMLFPKMWESGFGCFHRSQPCAVHETGFDSWCTCPAGLQCYTIQHLGKAIILVRLQYFIVPL